MLSANAQHPHLANSADWVALIYWYCTCWWGQTTARCLKPAIKVNHFPFQKKKTLGKERSYTIAQHPPTHTHSHTPSSPLLSNTYLTFRTALCGRATVQGQIQFWVWGVMGGWWAGQEIRYHFSHSVTLAPSLRFNFLIYKRQPKS